MNFLNMLNRRLKRKVLWNLLIRGRKFQVVLGINGAYTLMYKEKNIIIDHLGNINAPVPVKMGFIGKLIVKILTYFIVRKYYYRFYNGMMKGM